MSTVILEDLETMRRHVLTLTPFLNDGGPHYQSIVDLVEAYNRSAKNAGVPEMALIPYVG